MEHVLQFGSTLDFLLAGHLFRDDLDPMILISFKLHTWWETSWAEVVQQGAWASH